MATVGPLELALIPLQKGSAMRRVILPLMLLAVACQPATMELTEEQKAAIAEELTQAFDDYAVAVRQLDQESALGFFQQSEDIAFAEFGAITLSWSALAEMVREGWPMYASVESFEWGNLHIQVLAPTVAAVTTTFDFAATDTAGAPIAISGTFTAVWAEGDGEWKIVNVAETFPQPETPEDEV